MPPPLLGKGDTPPQTPPPVPRLLYAIAVPSVVCLWRWCTLLSRLKFSAISAIFHLWNAVSSKRCKIARCKFVLITNRKSYISFRLIQKSVTLNDLDGEMALIFCYFTEFCSFWGELRKSGWQRHNYGQFTITISSSKHLQRDRATLTA